MPRTPAPTRAHDLTVFGATGFVGELVAAHLAAAAPAGTRIALAGRSRERLERVRDELGEAASAWPLLVADSADEASLRSLAEASRVVVTTVGPYALHGLPLVAACAKAGTHYADLTGEVLFVRAAIDASQAAAVESGARIVVSCGFDSVPSDLGVLELHAAAARDGAGELTDTVLALEGSRGGFSGGTIASLLGQVERMRDAADRATALDPYALSPARSEEPDLGPERDVFVPHRDEQVGAWVAPFLMGPYNTRVVRRSNALSGYAYGRDFRYREVMALGDGPLGAAKAVGVTGGLGLGLAAALATPRRLLDRLVPGSGEGPGEAARSNGYFRLSLTSRTTSGAVYRAQVAAQGDPGYAATAVMIGEAGLALAEDETPGQPGVVTPATGIGAPLADRLRAQAFTLTAGPI